MLWIQRILFLSTAAKTKSPTSGSMIPLVTAEVATITLISPYINSHSQNKLIGLKKSETQLDLEPNFVLNRIQLL